MAIKATLTFTRSDPGPFWERSQAQVDYIDLNYVETGKVLEVTRTLVESGSPSILVVTTVYRDNVAMQEFLGDPVIQALRSEREAANAALGVTSFTIVEEI